MRKIGQGRAAEAARGWIQQHIQRQLQLATSRSSGDAMDEPKPAQPEQLTSLDCTYTKKHGRKQTPKKGRGSKIVLSLT